MGWRVSSLSRKPQSVVILRGLKGGDSGNSNTQTHTVEEERFAENICHNLWVSLCALAVHEDENENAEDEANECAIIPS